MAMVAKTRKTIRDQKKKKKKRKKEKKKKENRIKEPTMKHHKWIECDFDFHSFRSANWPTLVSTNGGRRPGNSCRPNGKRKRKKERTKERERERERGRRLRGRGSRSWAPASAVMTRGAAMLVLSLPRCSSFSCVFSLKNKRKQHRSIHNLPSIASAAHGRRLAGRYLTDQKVGRQPRIEIQWPIRPTKIGSVT